MFKVNKACLCLIDICFQVTMVIIHDMTACTFVNGPITLNERAAHMSFKI